MSIATRDSAQILVNGRYTGILKRSILCVRSDFVENGKRIVLFLGTTVAPTVVSSKLVLEWFNKDADVAEPPQKRQKLDDPQQPRSHLQTYSHILNHIGDWMDLSLSADCVYHVSNSSPPRVFDVFYDRHFQKREYPSTWSSEWPAAKVMPSRSPSQFMREVILQKGLDENGAVASAWCKIDRSEPSALDKKEFDHLCRSIMQSLLTIAWFHLPCDTSGLTAPVWCKEFIIGLIRSAKVVDPNQLPLLDECTDENRMQFVDRQFDAFCDASIYIANGLCKLGVNKEVYETRRQAHEAHDELKWESRLCSGELTKLVKEFTTETPGVKLPDEPLLVTYKEFLEIVKFTCVQVLSELAEAASAFYEDQHEYLYQVLIETFARANDKFIQGYSDNPYIFIKSNFLNKTDVGYVPYEFGMRMAICQELIGISIIFDEACCSMGLNKYDAECEIARKNLDKRWPEDGKFHRDARGKVVPHESFQPFDMEHYLEETYVRQPKKIFEEYGRRADLLKELPSGLEGKSLLPAYYASSKAE